MVELQTAPSSYGVSVANYRHPPPAQLLAATSTNPNNERPKTKSKSKPSSLPAPSPTTFPAPLVLPNDELALDPECPPQRVRDWLRHMRWLNGPERTSSKKEAPERRVIYVVAPPGVDREIDKAKADEIKSWAEVVDPTRPAAGGGSIPRPEVKDVVDYLAAFYKGPKVDVKLLGGEGRLVYTSWDEDEEEEQEGQGPPTKKQKSKAKSRSNAKPKQKRKAPAAPPPIALRTSTELIRIRTRLTPSDANPDPDSRIPRPYPVQLNLNDILDVAIEMLPNDAYALLILVNHDLYEDDDDEFIAGRAYGGSRVAIVSTARYHPLLDKQHDVSREGAWPGSHDAVLVRRYCNEAETSGTRNQTKPRKEHPAKDSLTNHVTAIDRRTPLHAAYTTHIHLPPAPHAQLSHLWLTRVCRTASHEVGHCFGIDHCVFYACVMQGSASLAEDARQPPYLCPVDLVKILVATGADERERYEAIAEFCAKRKWRGVHMFEALGAWINGRLREIGEVAQEEEKSGEGRTL